MPEAINERVASLYAMISGVHQGPIWTIANIITITWDAALLGFVSTYCRILWWKIRKPIPRNTVLVNRINLAVNWFTLAAMICFGALLVQEILVMMRAIPP